MAFRKNARQYILAIAVCVSVAVPVLCLPVGIRDGVSPSLKVRRAYAATFPEDEKTPEQIAEEEALAATQAAQEEGLIMAGQGTLIQSTYNEGYEAPEEVSVSFSDVPAYMVYQAYDESGLPIELLDTQYFAPSDEYLYIAENNSILKEHPEMDSITIQTLATGEGVTRIGVGDTWSKVRTESGAEGYVLTSTLSYEMVWIAIDRTVWVDTDSLTLRAEPSTMGEPVATLPDETRLHCTGIADKWYEVTTDSGLTGYVYVSYTTQTPPPTPTPTPTPVPRNTGGGGGGGSSSGGGGSSSGGGGGYSAGTPIITGANGSSVVSAAESILGAPYVWGGESSSGVDCSGLVVFAYRAVGVGGLPHYSNSLVNYGQEVSRDNIQPGDVVCYDYGGGYCGHVAIYVGGGTVIHASNSREDVRYGSLDMMPILTIRRIVG